MAKNATYVGEEGIVHGTEGFPHNKREVWFDRHHLESEIDKISSTVTMGEVFVCE